MLVSVSLCCFKCCITFAHIHTSMPFQLVWHAPDEMMDGVLRVISSQTWTSASVRAAVCSSVWQHQVHEPP